MRGAEIASHWTIGLGGLISQISQAWEIKCQISKPSIRDGGGRRDTDGALDRGEALYRNLHWNWKTSDHKVLPNKSMSSSANPKDRASYQHDVHSRGTKT